MNTYNLADEIESELALCRQIFERLTPEMLGWRPHVKSSTTGELAVHIADMAEWIGLATTTEELDYATKEQIYFEPSTAEELLSYFDARAGNAAASVRKKSADAMQEPWTIRNGQRVFVTQSREHIIRVDALNHIIHHRGQLTVYCRLKDVTLPDVYGPNGEE
jgi:uncharacterized damage-inducible protein DinB